MKDVIFLFFGGKGWIETLHNIYVPLLKIKKSTKVLDKRHFFKKNIICMKYKYLGYNIIKVLLDAKIHK